MTYPNMTPPSSPWSVVLPEVPGQRPPEPRQPVSSPYSAPFPQAPQIPPAPHIPPPPPVAQEPAEAEPPTEVITREKPAEQTPPKPEAEVQGQSHGQAETQPADRPQGRVEIVKSKPATPPAPEPASSSSASAAQKPAEAPVKPAQSSTSSSDKLIGSDQATKLRQRLTEAMPLFIDDPAAAVAQASEVVTEAVDQLAKALHAERSAIRDEDPNGGANTEQLRITLRAYREFLDRVLSL